MCFNWICTIFPLIFNETRTHLASFVSFFTKSTRNAFIFAYFHTIIFAIEAVVREFTGNFDDAVPYDKKSDQMHMLTKIFIIHDQKSNSRIEEN